MKTIILYRPMGEKEKQLVEASGYKKWPARLPEQPIFYPVTNERYACEIAEKWNTKDDENGNVGYVTKFAVQKSFMDAYHIECVGASHHTEYWIPAEDLEKLNEHIIGEIQIIKTYQS